MKFLENKERHNWTEFYYLSDFTDEQVRELNDRYDHLDDDEKLSNDWVKITFPSGREEIYHFSDFMRWQGQKPEGLKEWNGYKSVTFFSTVLIQISNGIPCYKATVCYS